MTLQQITDAANAFTDENFRATVVMNYVNEAIAIINAEVNSTLPYFSGIGTDYVALSEDWIRTLLIPYASYGIKQNDGSLNEASTFLSAFRTAFQRLLQNKMIAITEAYRGDNFGGIYLMETRNAINIGWFEDSSNSDGFE